MPRTSQLSTNGGKVDYYEIAMRQLRQQILPNSHPATTVWGCGSISGKGGPAQFNAPSLTIEATNGIPVRIKWVNQLVDQDGLFLPHLLPVDPAPHWANPPGGAHGRDTEVWEFDNTTGDAQPTRIHEVAFQVINRQSPAQRP